MVKWVEKNLIEVETRTRAVQTRLVMLQIVTAMFNNIVVPCAVNAFVSPSCYYNVFAESPTLNTRYEYQLCEQENRGNCLNSKVVSSSTAYHPSFQYTYLCSSSILVNYTPVFVTMCVIAMFEPLVEIIALWYVRHKPPTSIMYRISLYLLPTIVQPVDEETHQGKSKKFYKVNQLLTVIASYFGILLTFGVVFPPLSVALAVTLVIVVFCNLVKLGRFFEGAKTFHRTELLESVEKECRKVGAVDVLRRSVWLLLFFSCVFYSLFVFDTLGDEVGLKGAYWVLIVGPLMSFATYWSYRGVVYAQHHPFWPTRFVQQYSDGLEMAVLPSVSSIVDNPLQHEASCDSISSMQESNMF
jgi:hypothetical protein